MTKPLDFTYRIQYTDNTYQLVELTRAEYKSIGKLMEEGKAVFMNDEITLRLNDIRALVYLRPVPEPEPVKEDTPQLSEWGFITDPQELEDLRAMGLLGNGGDDN